MLERAIDTASREPGLNQQSHAGILKSLLEICKRNGFIDPQPSENRLSDQAIRMFYTITGPIGIIRYAILRSLISTGPYTKSHYQAEGLGRVLDFLKDDGFVDPIDPSTRRLMRKTSYSSSIPGSK